MSYIRSIWIAQDNNEHFTEIHHLRDWFTYKNRSNKKVSLDQKKEKRIPRKNDFIMMREDQKHQVSYEKPYNYLFVTSSLVGSDSLAHQNEVQTIWHLSGLPTDRALTNERIFRVQIFNCHLLCVKRIHCRLQDQHVISIVRDTNGLIIHDDTLLSQRLLRRIETLCARALYALSVDVGAVTLGVSGEGIIVLKRIECWLNDDICDDEIEALQGSLNQLLALPVVEHMMRIGADPEFIFMNSLGKVVPASKFLSVDQGSSTGADVVLIGNKRLYPIVELRPEPQYHPSLLFREIRKSLLQVQRSVHDSSLKWLAGAMPVKGLALGGHIHFSGAELTSEWIKLLDLCVALPVTLLEDETGRARRPKYGALGDFRKQSHGGFEYRTLPSWLSSPLVAKGSLSLAWLISIDRNDPALRALTRHHAELASKFRTERLNANELKVKFEQIEQTIITLPHYKEVEDDIKPFFEAIHLGKRWNELTDIRLKWGLIQPQSSKLAKEHFHLR